MTIEELGWMIVFLFAIIIPFLIYIHITVTSVIENLRKILEKINDRLK